ncbi:MAG TPA: alpha-amylase family glycosyl hydrolase [Chitinophagaceae bacterium]|nr:alpha-amylase family glycosyl hydrolase [Chitinophagaceae bacterium]
MTPAVCPSLYQVDAELLMKMLSEEIGRAANLDDVPDSELDKLACSGFAWIWLTNVWQTGREQRSSKALKTDKQSIKLAISNYHILDQLGGDAALRRLRNRLRDRGLKLMLDFVCNHSSKDHEWARKFPDYYIRGNETHLIREPRNYIRIKNDAGELILAHARDPYSSGWDNTLQLNYGNPRLQEAMMSELEKISRQCDGIHCEMPMLILPGIFEETWNIQCDPFWPVAINRVKKANPDFKFISEVYWEPEGALLQSQGFDYTYFKNNYLIVDVNSVNDDETSVVKKSIIINDQNFNDLKSLPINFLLPRASAS